MAIQYWDEEDGWMCEDVRIATVGMFTGLHDKNGKEVYEGDILKTAFSNKPFGVVTWHSDGYFFIDLNFGKLPISDGYRPFGEMLKVIYEDRPINIEVIGNIYDNPELIPYKDEQQ